MSVLPKNGPLTAPVLTSPCTTEWMWPRMNPETQQPVFVTPARYVLLPLANAITGYSVKAMERKIERGDWPEGKVWRRAPDGRILIDILGYQKWAESR